MKVLKVSFEISASKIITTNLAVSSSKDIIDADHDFIRTVQMATVFECLWVFLLHFAIFLTLYIFVCKSLCFRALELKSQTPSGVIHGIKMFIRIII